LLADAAAGRGRALTMVVGGSRDMLEEALELGLESLK